MGDEHPNVLRAREYFDTFAKGDFDAIQEFFSDDVVWHVPGYHAMSGEYRGKDELMAYFERARDMTGGTLTLEPGAIMANDLHIGLFVRVRGEREGRTLDVEMAEAFTVRPDGTWAEFWSMPDDQRAVDRFWA